MFANSSPLAAATLLALAVGFVVVAGNLANPCAKRAADACLGLLQAVGIEDIGREPGLGRQRSDGRADVAGGDAADLGLAELERPCDRARDHPVLVGKARSLRAVVLQIQFAQAQSCPKSVRRDQRRHARYLPDFGLSMGRADRQQLRQPPDVAGTLVHRQLTQTALGELVVVSDVKALPARRTKRLSVGDRPFHIAPLAHQFGHARARRLVQALRAPLRCSSGLTPSSLGWLTSVCPSHRGTSSP